MEKKEQIEKTSAGCLVHQHECRNEEKVRFSDRMGAEAGKKKRET